jgi:methionyl-tRNA formyltransferase
MLPALREGHEGEEMRLVYFATEAFAVPVLIKLADSKHELLAVVTHGNRSSQQSSVPELSIVREAGDCRVPLIVLEEKAPSNIAEKLEELKADLGIVSSFGADLPDLWRRAFPAGCIEVHPSLLPKHRGPAPINFVIQNKEKKTGVTVFRVIDQPYAGPILVQRETMIKPGEGLAGLQFRLARIACDAVDAALMILEKDPHFFGIAQDESEVSWSPGVEGSDAHKGLSGSC